MALVATLILPYILPSVLFYIKFTSQNFILGGISSLKNKKCIKE
tara:strand:- start:678 stop:809 length:132 start_codon:yes stop_codon:yes gene_type:complete